MRKHEKWLLIGGGVSALIALIIVTRVLALGIDRGDDAPAGSTHRVDPLGTKALYQGLNSLGQLVVTRNYTSFTQQELPSDAVMFMLGCKADSMKALTKEEFIELDQFVRGGGRLVVAMRDSVDLESPPDFVKSSRAVVPAIMPPGAVPPRGIVPAAQGTALKKGFYLEPFVRNWGVDLETMRLARNHDESRYIPQPATVLDGMFGLKEIPWHSEYVLVDLKENWTSICERGGKTVLAECRLGSGSVVLATDNYFLSNQGLRKVPKGEMVRWLLGGRSTVIFDETHMSVANTVGASTLIERYRLHWFLFSVIVVALLFVWRASQSLVPPGSDHVVHEGVEMAAGLDSSKGYIQLLQRHIDREDLLRLCFEEWSRSQGNWARVGKEEMEEVERILHDDEIRQTPSLILAAYQKICEFINPRRRG